MGLTAAETIALAVRRRYPGAVRVAFDFESGEVTVVISGRRDRMN
jgi:hypothetical protein